MCKKCLNCLYQSALSLLSELIIFRLFFKLQYFVEFVKFGGFSKNFVKSVKFGQHCEIWLTL